MRFSKFQKLKVGALMLAGLGIAIPAHAIIGIATMNIPLIVGGIVGAGVADCTFAYGVGVQSFCNALGIPPYGDDGTVQGTAWTIAGVVGIVLLDGSSGRQLVFRAVGADEAAKIGLNQAQTDAFNSNIPELNAVLRQVEYDLSKINNPTIKDSEGLWDRYSAAIPSQDAVEAAKMVAAAATKASK